MIFATVLLACAALVLFVMAFSNVFKGRIGQAVAFFVAALVAGGLAALTQTI